jgi:asparagine synthase (glutamine-hydrolysing)
LSGLLRPAAPDRAGRLHSALRFLDALPHPGWQRAARWMVLFGPEHRDALLGPDLAAAAALRAGRGESPGQRLAAMLAGAQGRDAVDRAMGADLGFYLVDDLMVKSDIAAMAFSLESRAPLIDHSFVEFAARLPARLKIRGLTTKRILRRAMRGHLPADILKRSKRGFGVPIGRWMRGPLAGLVRESLLGEDGARRSAPGLVGPVLRREGIERLWSEHAAGTADHGERLWALLFLVLWHRRFVEGGDLVELTRRAARP